MRVPSPPKEWIKSPDALTTPEPTPGLDVDQLLEEWRRSLNATLERDKDAAKAVPQPEPQSAPDSDPDPDPPNGWPRRLLHIASMTSRPWKEENPYEAGGLPKYAALSYTWGRYAQKECPRRKCCTYSSGDAIQINGIEWKTPPVCPKHFTVKEFRDIISHIQTTVEYLWLDVACIDQREGSAQKDIEIGRQYSIFNNATFALFWITTVDGVLPNAGIDVDPHNSFWTTLLSDPWFQSLWTLQEAYICLSTNKPTFIINRQAQTSKTSFGEIFDMWPIRDFLSLDWQRGNSEFEDIFDKIDLTGLRAMASKDPVRVYDIVKNRTASRPEDNIYAIQQIFQFQLGNTAKNREKKSFTLEELETQFGVEFAKRYPVQSQIRTFNSMVKGGHTWRITPASNTTLKPLSWQHLRPTWKKLTGITTLTPIISNDLDVMKFSGFQLSARDLCQRLLDPEDTYADLEPYIAWDQRYCVEAIHNMLNNEVRGNPGLDPRFGRAEDIVGYILSRLLIGKSHGQCIPAQTTGLGGIPSPPSDLRDTKHPRIIVLAIAKEENELCYWGMILVQAGEEFWLRYGVIRWKESKSILRHLKRIQGYFC